MPSLKLDIGNVLHFDYYISRSYDTLDRHQQGQHELADHSNIPVE